MSSDMEAGKVSNMLNRLFAKVNVSPYFKIEIFFVFLSRLSCRSYPNLACRQFDDLAQIHGVQKIDVIGDAYLAATNVIEDQVI